MQPGDQDRIISIMTEGLFPDLSESHRSRVNITLTLLDKALVKFEEWAQGREVQSVLYREENNLISQERAGILADIASIRRIMQEFRDDLQLKGHPQDSARAIRGHCYILWVDVLEMTGKYLQGFGEPAQEFVDYLDPKVNLILQYLDHIKILLLKH
jgi:hypothetical protein